MTACRLDGRSTVRGDVGGGSVGLLNGDVIDSVTVMAGVYPQEHPAQSGGWLELTLREGSRARTQAHASLSMTSASLVMEGPIGSVPRGSWLVSARQSYVQWIVKRHLLAARRDVQDDLALNVAVSKRLNAEGTGVRGEDDLLLGQLLEIDERSFLQEISKREQLGFMRRRPKKEVRQLAGARMRWTTARQAPTLPAHPDGCERHTPHPA